MKKYIVEGIGTFFLMFTIALCVNGTGAGAMTPIAVGAVLMVMVYAGGYISGAHYNPAVTLAVWMRGKCETKDVPWYMLAQFLGATLAAGLIPCVVPVEMTAKVHHVLPTLIVETIFTFALAFVVLNVATADKTAGNSYYGVAIGSTVMAGAFAIGPISGCALNPAVVLGAKLLGLLELSNVGAYLVANFTGGALAAIVYKHVIEAK